MKAVELKKLVLKIGEKTIELSPEEAKELKTILAEMFGADRTVYVDRWWPSFPHYEPYVLPHWTLTTGGTTEVAGTLYCANNDSVVPSVTGGGV